MRIEVQGWPDWEHLYLIHVQRAPPRAELDVQVTQREAALSSYSQPVDEGPSTLSIIRWTIVGIKLVVVFIYVMSGGG